MPSTNPEQKFVTRFEMAVMQFVILNKAKQGGVTRDNLNQTFKGNLQMSSDHLDHCIRQLVQDGHLREEGNKLTVTDDGREDVQKLQTLALELPNVIGGGGQRQGMTQQKTASGSTQGQSGGGSMGSSTGVSSGTAGNTGQGGNVRQGGMGGQQGGSGQSGSQQGQGKTGNR